MASNACISLGNECTTLSFPVTPVQPSPLPAAPRKLFPKVYSVRIPDFSLADPLEGGEVIYKTQRHPETDPAEVDMLLPEELRFSSSTPTDEKAVRDMSLPEFLEMVMERVETKDPK